MGSPSLAALLSAVLVPCVLCSCASTQKLSIWSKESKAELSPADRPTLAAGDVLLVIGEDLGPAPGCVTPGPKAFTVAVQCGSRQLAHLGVLRSGCGNEALRPQSFLSMPEGTGYVEAPSGGRIHRTWRLAAGSDELLACQRDGVIVFVSTWEDGKGDWRGEMRTRGMGSMQVLPLHRDQGTWENGDGGGFKGSSFRISQAGAYYLGDVVFPGGFPNAPVPFKLYELQDKLDGAKAFLGAAGLAAAAVVDVSDRWRDHAPAQLDGFLRGEFCGAP